MADIMQSGSDTAPKDLDQMCKLLSQALDCLGTIAAGCIEDENQYIVLWKELNIEALPKMAKQLCQEGGKVKTVYNKHKQCLGKISTEIQTSCRSKAEQVATSGGDQCAILSAAAKCQVAATEIACGCEAAEYPKEGFRLALDATKYIKECKGKQNETTAECKDNQYQNTGTTNSLHATFALAIISSVYILI